MTDTIVEEIRRIRDEHARQFNYDLHAMCEDLRREQALSGDKFVSLPKRPTRFVPRKQESERGPVHSRA
jgi:hypothetical protein